MENVSRDDFIPLYLSLEENSHAGLWKLKMPWGEFGSVEPLSCFSCVIFTLRCPAETGKVDQHVMEH